jgi:hypothetical protein
MVRSRASGVSNQGHETNTILRDGAQTARLLRMRGKIND